jgi:hypothetical protein
MNVDLNVYRMRIVSNHLRSARLPHSKRLGSAQLLLDMLFAHYKLIDITMFILFQIICKLHFDKATWHLPNNPQNVNRDINNEDIVSYRNKSLLSCVFASVVKQLIFQFCVWMCLLILRSGDVEINPGPGVSPTSSLTSTIRVITKLPNSEQSYKGKVKTHNYINRQNQSTIRNCENRNDPDLVQAFLKKWWVESDFKAPNLPLSLRFKGSGCHYNTSLSDDFFEN